MRRRLHSSRVAITLVVLGIQECVPVAEIMAAVQKLVQLEILRVSLNAPIVNVPISVQLLLTTSDE